MQTDAAAEAAEIFSACGHLDDLRDGHGRWRKLVVDNAQRVPGLDGRGTTTAVIDTGLTREHPQLSGAVIEQVDLTGQGIGDRCGHGTLVALLLVNAAPGVSLIDVKALGDEGKSSPRILIAALEWVGLRGDVTMVNLSAGVYRPWCEGGCDLCTAAASLSDQGVIVVAAAGNRPGMTACPAKAEAVFSVTSVDEWGELSPEAGDAGDFGFSVERPHASVSDAGDTPATR